MRWPLALIMAACIGTAACSQPEDTLHSDLGVPLSLRGVTFEGWLSGEVPHDDADTRAIRTMGGNAAKLVVPFSLLTRVDPVVREQRLQQILRMSGYAQGAGLSVVLSCESPAGASLFSSDREVRAAFVETWVDVVQRLADGPSGPVLRAIVPLEEPSEVLQDADLYRDLCSYLAQRLQDVRPGLAMFIVPLSGTGPDGVPVLSYPFVGATCRLPADAAALERVAIVRGAAEWSQTEQRPVLVDRVAPTVGLPREQWESVLGPCLSAIIHQRPAIHFLYDRMRSADEAAPGLAVRFPQEGAIRGEPLLQDLLSRAFKGALPRLPEVDPTEESE